MRITDSFSIALNAMQSNRLRAALTMLGMIIGVAAVISLMSVGKGAQASVEAQIQAMGTNLLFVTPDVTQAIRGGTSSSPGFLSLEDAEAIADPLNVPEAVAVAPELNSFAQVVAGAQNVNAQMMGVTPAYQTVRNARLAYGEFITQNYLDSKALVIVLGQNVARNLFGVSDPIGQEVRINRLAYRVIGVLAPKGGQTTGNLDEAVLIPLTTLQQRVYRQLPIKGAGHMVSNISVQVKSQAQIDLAKARITLLLRDRHRVAQDDFTVKSQEDLVDTASQVGAIMTVLLGSIAGISLLVGGIGIMNIMLVSVTERTREIGIRKAVGARQQDVLRQFLIESMVLSLAGGIIGILFGAGLAQIVSQFEINGQHLATLVSIDAVALAAGVSVAVGVFFGLYPAARASRLNPIDALRYE